MPSANVGNFSSRAYTNQIVASDRWHQPGISTCLRAFLGVCTVVVVADLEKVLWSEWHSYCDTMVFLIVRCTVDRGRGTYTSTPRTLKAKKAPPPCSRTDRRKSGPAWLIYAHVSINEAYLPQAYWNFLRGHSLQGLYTPANPRFWQIIVKSLNFRGHEVATKIFTNNMVSS